MVIILLFFTSCSQKPNYTLADSYAELPSQITELTLSDKEKLSAFYYTYETEESVSVNNETALELYMALNITEFREIVTNENFFENFNYENEIDIWLYVDNSETSENSRGTYSVYKNDIVTYSFSPDTSFCMHFKAPDGTYEELNKILKKANIK